MVANFPKKGVYMPADPSSETPETLATPPNQAPAPDSQPPVSAWLLLRVWLSLGLQSFGGGGATLALIRRAAVEQQGWLTEAEFTRYWALVQVAPGINLLALTILIGRRVAGARGIALALFGLLLPSVTIAILITAAYARIQHLAEVQAALRGIIPTTVGLGLLTAVQMTRSLLADGWREGKGSLVLCLLLLTGSGLAVAVWHSPVVLILIGSGAIGAAAVGFRRAAPETPPL